MSGRARGQLPNTIIDGRWPYQVEIVVPERGLLGTLDKITDWLDANAPGNAHGRGNTRRGIPQLARWAFATLETAESFHARFGGRMIDAGEENPRSRAHRDPSARPLRDILAERRAAGRLTES